MPRAGFELWLARRYPEHLSTVRARLSNVARIESFYGSLDDHYRRDRFASIFGQLDYSAADEVSRKPNPSRIPLAPTANLRNGLATLRGALKLYLAFLDEASGKRSGLRGRGRPSFHAQGRLALSRPPAAEAPPVPVDSLRVVSAPLPAPAQDGAEASASRVLDLLRRHAAVKRELTALGVLRTGNLVGEYGEWLFARAFGWRLASPSEKSHDAVDAAGLRYQIKARQDGRRGGAHQLGVLRNMGEDGWDRLAAVIFEEDFGVRLAVILPREIAAERAAFSDHQRGHLLNIDRAVLGDARCVDVTDRLRAAQT